jgi:outer membrane protein insertion porin family
MIERWPPFVSRWLILLLSAVVVLLTLSVPHAVSAQSRIDSIAIDGTIRVEQEAVRRRIRVSPGDELSPRTLSNTIRSIYELGFFDDIRVEAEVSETGGLDLTFIVQEKPSIASVAFEGNEKVDDDDIIEEIDVVAGLILDEAQVRAAAREIEGLYREKGFYLVEVEPRIVPAATGRVDVVFEVQEFGKVQIGGVSLVGNAGIDDRALSRVMQTRVGNVLNVLSSMGRFQEENLQSDLQNLRFVYYDSGYLDVAISDPVVELSRDRSRVFITIGIEEGDIYQVSTIGVSGDLLQTPEETMEMIELAPGDVFRSSKIREDIERIEAYYQDLGYAYATVNLLTDVDPDADTIGLEYDLDRGDLAYIGRINVVGNEATRDRVVRRELAIEEGDLYSRTAIRRSESWVQQLGFFESVTIRETASVLGPDRIDLEVEVVERHTRSLQVGAGFSSAESFLATAQIQENNLFGRGQNLGLNMMLSSVRTMFTLSFYEPHLFNSNLALQLDLFNRQVQYRDFDETRRGANVRFGYRPFRQHNYWRSLSLTVGYEIEDVRADLRNGFSAADDEGGLTSAVTYGVSLDRRNDRFFTTRGYYVAVDNTVADAVFGSENEFYKVQGFARGYTHPRWLDCAARGEVGDRGGRARQSACRWLRGSVLRANFELGYVGSLNARRGVPRFERFYPGGPDSVRGFDLFSLGPSQQQASTGDPNAALRNRYLGGNKNIELQLELEFPILEVVGIRGVVFADAGNAVGINAGYPLRPDFAASPTDENVLRTALGFGFRWRSPLGALRFEWGYPLQRREVAGRRENRSVFQFSIGPSF